MRNQPSELPPQIATPIPLTSDRQHELMAQFDADPYEGIRSLMLRDAYGTVPDHYLDFENPKHLTGQLSAHVQLQTERVLIDLVNNCDTGDEFERYMAQLRLRYSRVDA